MDKPAEEVRTEVKKEDERPAEYSEGDVIGTKPAYRKEKPNFFQKEEDKVQDYLLDHEPLRKTVDWTKILIVTAISAFLFAYGYRSFIMPAATVDAATGLTTAVPALISGGASGLSQIILRLFQLGGYDGDVNIVTSVCYFVINIPLFFIAWFMIGKKFAVTTLINVILSSVFIKFIPSSWTNIFSINGDYIARALVAGIMTGLSSGLAYVIGSSAGGVDIVTFAIAEKRSTTVGKYSVIINTCIVLLYTIINCIRQQKLGNDPFAEVALSLYTCIYFFTSAKMLDLVNIKNKKTELQINTDNIEMPALLLRAFPHGCTVIDGIGGYTGRPRKVIYMVVSASEVKKVVEFARKIDPNCFVNATNSTQVYGKFYIKPIE